MPEIILRFGINLVDVYQDRVNGPMFHRWLPDGKSDAIELDTGIPGAQLKVWFERRGYVDGGFITYNSKRKEVDPEILNQQGVVEGGPLFGELNLQNITEEEISALRENKIGDENYVHFGKKIVKTIIYPTISRFLDILCITYGQYWLGELKAWDSRARSLDDICNYVLNMEWSLDGGKTWKSFMPTRSEQEITIMMNAYDYTEYFKKRDWDEIKDLFNSGYRPSLAASIVVRANALFDKGDLKFAIIEGVTALEVAMGECVHKKLDNDKDLKNITKSFWNLSLPAKVTVLAAFLEDASTDDLKNTIEIIEIRNSLVHEGKNPPDKMDAKLPSLFNICAALIGKPRIRFLNVNPGNSIKPVEAWEKAIQDKVC